MVDLFSIDAEAPDFSLLNSEEKTISKADYQGSWLLLYFYPKDNTPGCTAEASDFSARLDDFSDLNVKIVGVSKDSVKSHSNFIAKHNLKIELLGDPDLKTIKAYKVWGIKKNYGKEYEGLIRSTFLIDPQGKIAKYWTNVRAKGHAERVLKETKTIINV